MPNMPPPKNFGKGKLVTKEKRQTMAEYLYERHKNYGYCDCANPNLCLFELGYTTALSDDRYDPGRC